MLEQTGLKGASIRQLLDQTTGVAYTAFPSPRELEKMDEATKKEWKFASPEMRRSNHQFARIVRASGIFRKLENEPLDLGAL